ncbi:type III secretion system inner membrane ring subunit SctD [Bordetella sp. BOR01]|uniref:type III secretion system inner membrane ring subunit SctD n=1 Tax=Bordetella sp. BOR01 TaxID=2854779 RepID=UPI001C46FCE7|nr:type III secretion system inner membrane ring subunit SctD [Bordetella sp. BOR01]MBV7485217.1 type III secretion system inner membrane ring subunit SctD [Bordetella sp. BOR01]
MSPALELRVLSGMHREARCPASNGAVLGADPDCDIVLADTGLGPRAARLRVGTHGWDLVPDPDAASAPPLAPGDPATPFNRPLPLGPIWITVAHSADPWTALPLAANDESPPAEAMPAPAADALSARPAPPVPSRPIVPPPRKRDTWPMVLGLGAVVLAVLVVILMSQLLPGDPRPTPPVDPRAAAQQSLGKISAAIDRLGLSSRLHIAILPNGTVRVSGWVRNAAEQDRLAATLSQIWPMPAMRVSVEDVAIETAANALKAFSVKYVPRYDGDGRLTILGIAASARERASALDALRAQLPGMTVLGNDIALAPQVADDFARQLAEAGLSGVSLTWKPHFLEAGAQALDDYQLEQLQTLIARFNTTHVDVVQVAQSTGERQYADSVPFTIRSVVSGPQPFIVLQDGSKLLVGGVHGQYRLTAIEPTRIIFEGPRPAIILR